MINDGLDGDFFKKQYPRLEPMTHEEYRDSPKRTITAWDDVEER